MDDGNGGGDAAGPMRRGASRLLAPGAALLADLAPRGPVRRLLAVAFVDALGTGLFLAGSALFFTRDLGLSAGVVGLGLSLGGVAGLLGAVPVGRASDRAGPRRALVALQVWRGACFVAYPFADTPARFVVVACLAGAGEWAAPPVVQSLVAALVPARSRVTTLANLSLLRNVAFAGGALAASAAIVTGGGAVYRALVLADAASFLVAAVMLVGLRPPADGHPAVDAPAAPGAPMARSRSLPDVRFLALTALNGLLSLHSVLLGVGLPLWIGTATRAPRALIGATVVLNTVLAVVLQRPLSRGVGGLPEGAARQARAGLALAACCLLVAPTGALAAGPAAALLLAATALLTVAEVYQAVGAWRISLDLSPAHSRGYHLSVYNLGTTGMMIAGPALLTVTVLPAGGVGWAVLAAVSAAAGLLVPGLVGRAAARGPGTTGGRGPGGPRGEESA